MKNIKLNSIEKFAKKLDAELNKMYNYNGSHEEKYWSLKREVKIKRLLHESEDQYQYILKS